MNNNSARLESLTGVVGALGAGQAYCAAGAGLVLIGILGLFLTRGAPAVAAQPVSCA